jgi:hypothetical protein
MWKVGKLSSARQGSDPAGGIVVGIEAAEYIRVMWNISLPCRIWSRPLRLLSGQRAPFSTRKLTGGHDCSHKMPYLAPGMLCPSAPWEVSEDHSLGGSSR